MVRFAASLGNAGKPLINRGALSLNSLNWFLNVWTWDREIIEYCLKSKIKITVKFEKALGVFSVSST